MEVPTDGGEVVSWELVRISHAYSLLAPGGICFLGVRAFFHSTFAPTASWEKRLPQH